MYSFLKNYAKKFNLNDAIRFEHQVVSVSPFESGKWKLIVKDLTRNEEFEAVFDAVFVCNGHYSNPRIAAIPGIEHFLGETLHSHDYRFPESCAGKRVLVIGAGPSGIDVVMDVSTSASRVFFSHHHPSLFTGYSKNVTQKPDVSEVCHDGAVKFKDGTTEFIDTVIFCTGYNYYFPFLSAGCDIRVDDNHVTALYKHIVNIRHPTMFFIGMTFLTINTLTMESQVSGFCLLKLKSFILMENLSRFVLRCTYFCIQTSDQVKKKC